MADAHTPTEFDWIAPQGQPEATPAPKLYFPSAPPSRTSSAASNQSSTRAHAPSAYPARGASLGAGATHSPSTAAPPSTGPSTAPSLPPRPLHEHADGRDAVSGSSGGGSGGGSSNGDLSLLDAVTSLSPSMASPPSPPPPAAAATSASSAAAAAMPAPIPIPTRSASDLALSPDSRYGALPLSNTDSSAYSLDLGSPLPSAPAGAASGLGFHAHLRTTLGTGEDPSQPTADRVNGGDDLPPPPPPPPSLPTRQRQNSLGGGDRNHATPPELPLRQPGLSSDLARNSDSAIPTGFDEGALRALCEMDVSPTTPAWSPCKRAWQEVLTGDGPASLAVRHAVTTRPDEAEHDVLSGASRSRRTLPPRVPSCLTCRCPFRPPGSIQLFQEAGPDRGRVCASLDQISQVECRELQRRRRQSRVRSAPGGQATRLWERVPSVLTRDSWCTPQFVRLVLADVPPHARTRRREPAQVCGPAERDERRVDHAREGGRQAPQSCQGACR